MEALGALTAKALRGSWRAVPPVSALSLTELEAVTPHMHATGTSGLVWWTIRNDAKLNASVAAPELLARFRTLALDLALHEVRLAAALDLAAAAGAEPLLLKGWSVARLYPSPGLRPCGDVDLAVPAAVHTDLQQALDTRPADRDWIDVDLEHRFLTADGTPLRELMARSRRVPLGDREVPVLGEADQLRLVCVHYLRAGGWPVRALCDVALLLEAAPADLDWDVVLKTALHRGWVLVAAGLAERLLGADLTGTPVTGAGHRVPSWVVQHVLAGFGTTAAAHNLRHAPFNLAAQPAELVRQLRERWPADGLDLALHHRRPVPKHSPVGLRAYDLAYRGAAFVAPVKMRRARRDGSPEVAR